MITNNWAHPQDGKKNYEHYKQIKHLADIHPIETGYGYFIVKVIPKESLTELEEALIADRGNLCFGYTKVAEHTYKIYTD